MPLSDAKIRAAKPKAKAWKLGDFDGLFVLVQPEGGKLWRFKYRLNGKERKLSFGRYPDVPLQEARRRRDEARAVVALGKDPAEEKKQAQLEIIAQSANSFECVAEEYLTKVAAEGREAVTIKKSRWLLSLLTPSIGTMPVAIIKPADLLAVIKPVHDKGHYETARRMKSFAGRVFRYAVATSRAENDPSSVLRGALIAPKVKHHAAILEPKQVGALLRAIEAFNGQELTQLALQLTPHVFVRPGELRRAEWPEFDFEAARWVIPAEKMKMRRPHVIPLSTQSLAILTKARSLSAGHTYVFSSLYPGTRPMSENTINAALRRMGYSGQEMTAHGFRAMASTLLNESGRWSPDAIERALAHDTSSTVRGNYHRGEHWEERKRMAQWWSDYLDELKAGQMSPVPDLS